MKNTLVVIGYTGIRRAYLNVPVEEAERRYREAEDLEPEDKLPYLHVFEFEDEFNVYDAWAPARH